MRVRTPSRHNFSQKTALALLKTSSPWAKTVKKIIHPCGYFNSKTKAIMGSATAIATRGGVVPSDFNELTSLPGVGAKTAQVIMAQWFKLPGFAVDTHVHRVCNRLGIANSGTNRDKTERQVKAIVPPEHWSKLHLQLVFHGRKTCTLMSKCYVPTVRTLCVAEKTKFGHQLRRFRSERSLLFSFFGESDARSQNDRKQNHRPSKKPDRRIRYLL
jgi:endonuclease III